MLHFTLGNKCTCHALSGHKGTTKNQQLSFTVKVFSLLVTLLASSRVIRKVPLQIRINRVN